ncbi:MAG: hypothetical protein WD645_03345, partial [Dehalococcoidia bacterium]
HLPHILAIVALPLVLLAATACSGGALRAQETVVDEDQQWIDFVDSNDEIKAQFFVWPRQTHGGFTEVVVEIPSTRSIHDGHYRLDSFTLDLTTPGAIALPISMAPAPAWESMAFHQYERDGVRLHVADTGQAGDGTIYLEFWVPNNILAEHGLVVRGSLQTAHGEAFAEIRIEPSEQATVDPVLPTFERGGAGGDGALLTGELAVEGRCLYVIGESGTKWLPVFPADLAAWEDGGLVLRGERHEVGGNVSIGGGETPDLSSLALLQEPDAACETRNSWVAYLGEP